MSNHDDFWTTLAAGHTNTVLAGSMDTHLSGKSIEESFGSVRTLTDMHRAANALVLPVEAGTKVVFAGNLGAHMSYDDAPADGITGEVVTVRSATGEITHHDGKVFVKWADGKFRPVHAEHLRLAGSKTAALRGGTKVTVEDPYFEKEYGTDRGTVASPAVLKSFRLKKRPPGQPHGVWVVPDVGEAIGRETIVGLPEGVLTKRASDIKAQFEKIKALAEKRPDSKFLKSILKQMADKGFAPTDKQMAVVKKIEGEIKQQGEMKKELKGLDKKGEFNADDIGKKQNGPLTSDPEDKKIMDHFGQGDLHEMTEVANDKTAMFRVASLGDLTDFLKVSNGALVHKSTKDLWSYSKDADGNFLVSRLFDDEGEPLKV